MEPAPALGFSTFNPKRPTSLALRPELSLDDIQANFGSNNSNSCCDVNAATNLHQFNTSTIQAQIPTPAQGTTNGSNGQIHHGYQIHDGFATVRKRKGPSRTAIAMQQQQHGQGHEFYGRQRQSISVGNTPVGNGAQFACNCGLAIQSNSSSAATRHSINNDCDSDLWISTANHDGQGHPASSPSCDNKHINISSRLKPSSSLRHKLRRLVLPKNQELGGGGGGLRNSYSDNSIVNSAAASVNSNGGHYWCPVNTGPGFYGTVHRTTTVPSDYRQHHQLQHHRSCFLPKPPPPSAAIRPLLEPVLEDCQNVARRPRKDIPWWELATRKHRYRSCPLLQVTQQVDI